MVFDTAAATSVCLKDTNNVVNTFPSYVYVHPATGEFYVAEAALAEARHPNAQPQNLLHSWKRALGKRYVSLLCLWFGNADDCIYSMSEQGIGESIAALQEKMGNVELCGDPKLKDHIRFKVNRYINGKDASGGLRHEYISPSTCVLHMVAYLISVYIKRYHEIPELVMQTVPSTSCCSVRAWLLLQCLLLYCCWSWKC